MLNGLKRLAANFSVRLLNDDKRLLDFIIRLTAIAYIATLLLSWQTFIRAARIYASAPVFDLMSALPLWSDWLCLGLHLAALGFLIAKPRWWQAALLSCALTLIYAAGDIGRQQPFFLMFSFVVLCAALPKVADSTKLQALRLMVIGVYFWAGFHKINASFYDSVFPWFIAPIAPAGQSKLFMLAVMLAPFFELMIGVLLIFKRTRVLASLMAAFMLATVLMCLGPFGHNWAQMVWPWNAWLHFTELCLFLGTSVTLYSKRALPMLALMVFMLLPAGGTLAWWPELFGFKLYSGNINSAKVVLDEAEDMARLPPEVSSVANNHEVFVFDWITWAGITPHPSDYVLRTGAKGLCSYLQQPERAYIRVSYAAPFYSTVMPTQTFPLCTP